MSKIIFDVLGLLVYYNSMTIEQIKEKAIPIFDKYRIAYAGVFGSVARGESRSDSDVDILVSFEKIPGLVQFIRMENELKQVLGTDVDLVVQGSEKSLIKANIEKDLMPLYGKRSTI